METLLAAVLVVLAQVDEEPEEAAEPLTVPPIVVIGRRADEGVPVVPFNAIGSRDVFGPEQVRETGARDLNDLVQNLPAISTRPYNGGEAAAPSFSMRGLPDDGLTEYVHVLIDGVPASPLPYGWTAFSFLPITTERVWAIDYIRGAHSVRYSPNTVGGILNFITPPIPDAPTFRTRTTVGSFGYSSSIASFGRTSERLGLAGTLVERRGDGYRDRGEWDQSESNVKLRHELDDGRWVAASLSYMESDHKAPGGLTLAQFNADRFGNGRPLNAFEGSRGVADVVLHEEASDGSWWEGFSYYSETERHLRAQRPHFGTPTTLSDWTDTSEFLGAGLRAEREVEIGGMEHKLFGGVRFHRDWIDHWRLSTETFPGGPGTPTLDAEYQLDTWSAHLDDTFSPAENLLVTVGLRAEWVPVADGKDRLGSFDFEDDFSTLMPGVGASYLLSESWAVFGNYFEGFRAPQVWGFGSATGDDTLEFEQGRSMELGARYEGTGGLWGSLTSWRTTYDDFGVFFTGSYENLGRIEADGIDVEVEWDAGAVVAGLDGLTLAAAATFQDSKLKSGPNAGNETPYAWEQKATWRARYATPDRWVLSLGGSYVGDSFSDDANTAVENADGNLGVNPSRTLWDAQVSRSYAVGERGTLRLAVGATNLFGKDWFVHSRGGFFGGGKVAGPPRQTYAMISVNLPF